MEIISAGTGVQISVIVPVYKVEPYLRTCIDSILSQTLLFFFLASASSARSSMLLSIELAPLESLPRGQGCETFPSFPTENSRSIKSAICIQNQIVHS